MGAASGVTWLILGFYVPLLVVSLALIIWQLYSRRGEAIDNSKAVSIGQRSSVVTSP
jgi:hypothetical protein